LNDIGAFGCECSNEQGRVNLTQQGLAYFYQKRNRTKSLEKPGSSDPAAAGVEITRLNLAFRKTELADKNQP